jgi:S1-C subfamily serine protease
MARLGWIIAVFLTAALVISACGGDVSTEMSAATPNETPTPTLTPTETLAPAPTTDVESVVRRVLAEQRGSEPPTPTSQPIPTVDVEAITFEVTERVLATLEARETPTPEPTPEPTPTVTPTPTPSLPSIIRGVQKSLVRITGLGNEGDVAATGIVVAADSSSGEIYVLARYESVTGLDGLEATTIGGARYEASIHGADETRDVALLRLCCDTAATPVSFGDALTLVPGSEVAALEFRPQSVVGAVASRGIVSSVLFDGERERWIIQTDAAVSGEGGGALITPDGGLVGMLIDGVGGALGSAVSELTLSELLPDLR